MSQVYQLDGEMTDNRTLKLDKALPDGTGRVRVTVEVLTTRTRPDLTEFMEKMWETQRERGHVPPTKEMIDAYMNAERDSWDS